MYLGFDCFDIKPSEIDPLFQTQKMRIFHDFLLGFLSPDHVVSDDELILFKEICEIMVDKTKTEKLVQNLHTHSSNTGITEFSLDSFTDDDNLLDLDDIFAVTKSKDSSSASLTQELDLEVIEEEFDDFEQILKDMSLQNLANMQSKLAVELAKDEIKEILGIDASDEIKDQILDEQLKVLEKEHDLLMLELQSLEDGMQETIEIDNKENKTGNI